MHSKNEDGLSKTSLLLIIVVAALFAIEWFNIQGNKHARAQLTEQQLKHHETENSPSGTGWVEVDNDASGLIYADPSTISKVGSSAKMWMMTDLKTATKYNGRSFMSLMARMEYNCNEGQSRKLEGTLYAGKMGTGEVIHTFRSSSDIKPDWEPAKLGSVDVSLWKIACQPTEQQVPYHETENSPPEEGWIAVIDDIYSNPSSIRKADNKAIMWQMVDLKTPIESDGRSFMSIKTRMEYDCKEGQKRGLAFSLYAGNMGTGEVVLSSTKPDTSWSPVKPGTEESSWKIACES